MAENPVYNKILLQQLAYLSTEYRQRLDEFEQLASLILTDKQAHTLIWEDKPLEEILEMDG